MLTECVAQRGGVRQAAARGQQQQVGEQGADLGEVVAAAAAAIRGGQVVEAAQKLVGDHHDLR